MSLSTIRPTLISLHRWVGLVLTPIFLLVILSGSVLSFRPIVGDLARAPIPASVDVVAVSALVQRLDARSPLTSMTITADGRSVDVGAADATVAGRWDIASGDRIASTASGFDVFAVAERLHKQLLVGLGIVVEIATWAMTAIVIIAPLMTWLRFRQSLIGWHMGIGWCLLPLALLAPLTGVLMTLHVGDGGTPLPRAARTVSMPEALAIAARDTDLSGLASARRFRAGTVMMQVRGETPSTLVVTEARAVPLAGGPSWVKQVHEGTWGGVWSGLLNFVVSLVLLGLTVTGFWSWYSRHRRNRPTAVDVGADVLVAHASQTGTAARLAQATARRLEAGGRTVALAPIGTMSARDLRRFTLVLLIASTTGDGEVPDGARGLPKALELEDLGGVRFAVLGLGDRSYASFCAGSERLRAALCAAGAEEVLAPMRADGEPSVTWESWIEALRTHLGLTFAAAEASIEPAAVTLRLVDRVRLDDETVGDTQETWRVSLESAAPLAFRPGDLLRIAPEDGARERSYSIGSSSRVDPRRIELTVKLHRWIAPTGERGNGVMSERLVRSAAIGAALIARIAPHPSFNPPDDPSRPILLVGAGTGIAPFPGFLEERRLSGRAGPAWLVFGNRHAHGDFLWRSTIEKAVADRTLSRLDTAFSRDDDARVHVQDRLSAAAEEVSRWLAADALVYVCGRREMVLGVIDVLTRALAEHGGWSPEAARIEIDRRISHDLIRIDAFD